MTQHINTHTEPLAHTLNEITVSVRLAEVLVYI